MLNFTVLGSLETFFLFFTLFGLSYASVCVCVGGGVDPTFFLYISSLWVEISLYVEFQPSRLPRTWIFLNNPI